MKSRIKFKMGSCIAWFPYSLAIKSLILSAFIFVGIQASLQAQEAQFTRPSWFLGGAIGGNFNFYQGTIQELNNDLTIPAAFHHGKGVGLYLAPLLEYHRPNTRLGFMLQLGYDNRKGKYERIFTPCNCPADLAINISYVTIEPSLRIAPFKSNFYVYAGPRFAFNSAKSKYTVHSFTYKQGINPDYPLQMATQDVQSDLSKTYNSLISMQVGAGFDIPLSSKNRQTQFVLSPFVSFHPYFGQDPRSIETWTVTTLRAGIALKFGQGHKISVSEVAASIPAEVVVIDPEVQFTVNAPKNITVDRRVREIFPLRNYVFFNAESTDIPDRYVLLRKEQVSNFKEDQLEVFTPKNLSGRSKREMVVYYNVLNILGDRMEKNPSTTIILVGSSNNGPKEGRIMAESVKQYLVDVFGINASRISIEGRNKPIIPSESVGGELELGLLREGDRRVTIESSSPVLLMEFQSGPNATLKPVEIIGVQEAPVESYVSFIAEGGGKAFSSWSLEITDETGKVQNFGPYTQEVVSIPGKNILGVRPEGDYKVTMIGQTKSSKTVKKETSVHIVLWVAPQNEEMMRFSILYEFNNSKAITIYQKYLTDIVTPKIPIGGTVIIHGHTDIIGDEDHNLKLSLDRANDVRNILEIALSKSGRTDVKFEVSGFGEDQNLAPFDNKYPEERFYNRTVIIDIIPQK
jgi:outer membrane protein OmpA-like peptidoglycan-associated protein